jgi:CRP-like cAMP-binding protein
MSVRADVETFRNIPIFSECEPVHLQLLAFSAVRESFEPGSVFMAQGQEGKAAYLILNGRVDISSDENGKIGSAGPGAMLGEVAMIGDSAYTITARATEALSAARIDRALFMRLAQEYPEFGTAVFAALAARLQNSIGEFDAARPAFEQARSFKSL